MVRETNCVSVHWRMQRNVWVIEVLWGNGQRLSVSMGDGVTKKPVSDALFKKELKI